MNAAPKRNKRNKVGLPAKTNLKAGFYISFTLSGGSGNGSQ